VKKKVNKFVRYDRLVAVLASWMVFGVFLDGWGHHHGATESFYTPWHFALYSGYAATAAALFGYAWRRRRQGIKPGTPAGYRTAVRGAAIFAIGGFCDGVWHNVFGIEHKVEAFISPPHVTLFISGVMLTLGPFAAWRHRHIANPTWRNAWPAIVSLTGAVGLIQFSTENDNALLLPAPAGEHLVWPGPLGPHGVLPFDIGVGWGFAAIVVQSLLVAGAVIVLNAKMRAPFGATTLILVVGIGHSVVIHNTSFLLLPIAAAGLVGDLLVHTRLGKRLPEWGLPAAVPATMTAGWMLTIALTHHIVWTVHLATGSVVVAAVTGAAVSYIASAKANAVRRPIPAAPRAEVVTTHEPKGEPARTVVPTA
jgi:hypothetical protein